MKKPLTPVPSSTAKPASEHVQAGTGVVLHPERTGTAETRRAGGKGRGKRVKSFVFIPACVPFAIFITIPFTSIP